MSENMIKTFINDEFGNMRTVIHDEKVLFCASDIAKSLGYRNPRKAILDHCRYVTKRDIPHPQSPNKTISMSFIPEGDVYRLIAHSKLTSAERFEKWVFDEVLPTIRKTGGYVSNEDLFINTYLPFADDNTKALFRTTLSTITQLNHKIEQDKPLVDFANHIQVSEDCISMNDMAKLATKNGIKIGRNKLFAFLRNEKVLKPDNIPYQRYMELQPWFQIKESTYDTATSTHITLTTVVTSQGQRGIINMLKRKFVT